MNREWLPYLLLVLLAFVWGSSFILMQTALFDDNRQPVLSVYQVGSLRILVSGIVKNTPILPMVVTYMNLLA